MFYIPEMSADDRELMAVADYHADGSKVANVDPYLSVAQAAAGDIDAMRGTADAILLWVLGRNDPTPTATLREGLIFARMAASRGETDDIRRLIYLLAYAGMICSLDELSGFAGEMLAMVEIMAERGDEACATLLASVAEHETLETMQGAKEIKARISNAWGLE
jgi:hypothetical protein